MTNYGCSFLSRDLKECEKNNKMAKGNNYSFYEC